jgi:hypothetical protein
MTSAVHEHKKNSHPVCSMGQLEAHDLMLFCGFASPPPPPPALADPGLVHSPPPPLPLPTSPGRPSFVLTHSLHITANFRCVLAHNPLADFLLAPSPTCPDSASPTPSRDVSVWAGPSVLGKLASHFLDRRCAGKSRNTLVGAQAIVAQAWFNFPGGIHVHREVTSRLKAAEIQRALPDRLVVQPW